MAEDLCNPTEMERKKIQIHQLKVGPSWMDPIVLFLKDDILPEKKGEADKMRKKLYKRSFSGLYLLCIHPKAVEPLLEELHKGI